MDFELPYSEEQERFRQEVRAWLEENVPENMKEPIDPNDLTEEQFWFWRGKHKELAAKGWLYPTYPKEYGGGGLSGEQETVIQEEFHRARIVGSFISDLVLGTLMVWGTKEQKQKFLVPLLKAETTAWQKFTEPQSGADLANYQGTAVRDGDDWVLTGVNVFCSGRGPAPGYLFGPMKTDSDAPRHRNLGFFMIPYPSPGLEIQNQNLVNGSDQHFIFMDNVRVPGDHLVGGDHQGWQVTNTTLEQEHGGRGQAVPRDKAVDNLVRYMKERQQKGESSGGDPVRQQVAVDALIDAEINALLQKRVHWKYQNGLEMSWEGSLTHLFTRSYGARTRGRLRDVMGMYALLDTKDPLASFGGFAEVNQRSFAGQFAAGGLTITRLIVARRIGISRTKERAAPTPSTTASSKT